MQLQEQHLIDMASMVVEEAEERFNTCGAEDDFCVQHVGQSTVFGGTNRLIWSPKHGWQPDRQLCTERFLNAYDSHYGDSK